MASEAVKISPQNQSFLDNHFGISPQWEDFHKKLKSRSFMQAVEVDTRSNDKLKAFAQAVGMRDQSRGKAVKVKSDSSGSYNVKYHPDAGRFSCTCPDWTYKRSVGGGDCKHIDRLKSSTKDSLMKTAGVSPAEVMFRIGRTINKEHKDKAETKRLNAENQIYDTAYHRPGFIAQWVKHAHVGYGIKLAKEMSQAARRMMGQK